MHPLAPNGVIAPAIRRALAGLPVATFALSTTALAQEALHEPALETVCEGAVITQVVVENHSIYDASPADSAAEGAVRAVVGWASNVANRLHRRTRPSFIERELLFRQGDCLDPLMLEESERLLRALPFISEADVYAVPAGEDQVHVVVETRDEWTLEVDPRWELDNGLRLRHLAITEENLWGTGTLLGFFRTSRDEKLDLGVQLRTAQFMGTRLDTHVSAGRTRTGVFFTESLSYPFVGEVGRWAFVESYALREDLFSYAASPGAAFSHASLPIQTRIAETTLGRRLGTPGDLTVLAGGVSWEDIRFEGFPGGVEVVSDSDFSVRDTADSATIEAIRPQVSPRRGAYLNLLAGKRNVRFVSRRGLDAIRGEQDIRVGTQVLAALGTSIARRWSSPVERGREMRGRLSLFAGSTGATWVFNTETTIEGARSFGGAAANNQVRDILGEFGAHLYWQPGETRRHTFVLGLSGSGGWNNTIPFQLTLGGPSGLRGYDLEDFPAAQRIVVNLEDRITLGGSLPEDARDDRVRNRRLFDFGLAFFVDAGAGWSGGTPFGIDSGLQASAGAGIRVAFPSGARQVVRLDLAAPVGCRGFDCVQFRVGYDAVSLLRGFDDRQMRRSRAAGPAAAFLDGGR